MTEKNARKMSRAGYYIPKRHKEWLEEEAHRNRRSASFFLTELLDKVNPDHNGSPIENSSK